MFKLINIHNDAEVVVSYGDQTVSFVIESIINRRLRDIIYPDKVFIILNAYVASKPVEFREELFKRYVDAKNTLFLQMHKNDIDPIPVQIAHNILDMFDYEDVLNFIKTTKIIKAPSDLPTEFNSKIIFDEKGSREQTYIKEDYIELIALITILKTTAGPIGEFATLKDTLLSKSDYKYIILFTFYSTHFIMQTPPFIKLKDSIIKLTNRLFASEDNTAIRLIENTVSRDNLPTTIISLIVIQKLLINAELDDTNQKNTVTKIYSFASNRLKLKDNNNSDIRIKRFNSGGEDLESEASIMESYRSPSSITMGFLSEFEIVFEDPIRLARWIGVKAPDEEIFRIVKTMDFLKEPLPIKESINILAWILKDVIDPRAFEYIEIDNILLGLGVAVIYLIENGFGDLAMLLSSFAGGTDDHKLNFSLRNKLDQELREKLLELFPNNKKVGTAGVFKESSFIEETITNLSKEIMGYNLVSVLPNDVVVAIKGNASKEVVVRENIKNRLAELIVFINS